MVLGEDEETQKKGTVGLLCHLDQNFGKVDYQIFSEGPKFLYSGPVHICVNNPVVRVTASVLVLAVQRDRQARIRIHDGMYCRFYFCDLSYPFMMSNQIIISSPLCRNLFRMSIFCIDVWGTDGCLAGNARRHVKSVKSSEMDKQTPSQGQANQVMWNL